MLLTVETRAHVPLLRIHKEPALEFAADLANSVIRTPLRI
jgi:hypothetical protein